MSLSRLSSFGDTDVRICAALSLVTVGKRLRCLSLMRVCTSTVGDSGGQRRVVEPRQVCCSQHRSWLRRKDWGMRTLGLEEDGETVVGERHGCTRRGGEFPDLLRSFYIRIDCGRGTGWKG
jgi:hypothetical protein